LSEKRRRSIRRHVTLSLLSFGKLLMYRDLDSRIWPAIAKHPLVTKLFETYAEAFGGDDQSRSQAAAKDVHMGHP
jgi:hypothetical protein